MPEPDVLDAYEREKEEAFDSEPGAGGAGATSNIATDEELREFVDTAIEVAGWGFPEPAVRDWKRRHGDSLMRMSRRFRVDEIVAGKSTGRLMPNRPAWQVALLGGGLIGFVLYRQRQGYVEFMTQQAQEAQEAQGAKANPGGDSEGVAGGNGRAGAGAASD